MITNPNETRGGLCRMGAIAGGAGLLLVLAAASPAYGKPADDAALKNAIANTPTTTIVSNIAKSTGLTGIAGIALGGVALIMFGIVLGVLLRARKKRQTHELT